MSNLRRTGLYDLHKALGARIMPFAGYELPVQYPAGVLKEHLHCRSAAGLFDVSHMGQILLRPKSGNAADAARALEALIPADIVDLAEGRQRYALLTNNDGGIVDDLIVANRGDHLFLVVNAACKADDIAHLRGHLRDCDAMEVADRALLALQGPAAEASLEGIVPGMADLKFMDAAIKDSDFGTLWVSRSGYTGEDGFEISVQQAKAEDLARTLLSRKAVEPIGLGARDSLRLEAGLCLYGSDIDAATSPVEAALEWTVQKVRRAGGARSGGFPGAERILGDFAEGAARRRVGLLPEGRAPMRAGTEIYAKSDGGSLIGRVTSGSYGPSISGPVSMGYVGTAFAEAGTTLYGEVRGKRLPVKVASMPFRPAAFKR